MERLDDIRVMLSGLGFDVKKKQETFFLPPDLRQALQPYVARFGGPKKKWLVYVAGLVSLLERSEAEVSDLIGEVSSADSTGRYAELLTAVAMRRARRTGEIVREPNGVMTDGYGAAIPPMPPGRASRAKGGTENNPKRTAGEVDRPGRTPGKRAPRRK